jgi:hypothetical protein
MIAFAMPRWISVINGSADINCFLFKSPANQFLRRGVDQRPYLTRSSGLTQRTIVRATPTKTIATRVGRTLQYSNAKQRCQAAFWTLLAHRWI